MKTIPLIGLLAAVLPASVVAQQTPPAPELPTVATPNEEPDAAVPSPQQFAARAAADNRFVIRAAEIVLRADGHEEVKKIAETMLRDHRKAQQELADAAKTQSVALHVSLRPDQEEKLQALKNAPASQLDNVYRSAQMIAIEDGMRRLSLYSAHGAAGALKAYAGSAYPTFRSHLMMVRTDATR
jgi:putative membrane protein